MEAAVMDWMRTRRVMICIGILENGMFLKRSFATLGTIGTRPPVPRTLPVLPASAAAFTGRPVYNDLIARLDHIHELYARQHPSGKAPVHASWPGTLSRPHLSNLLNVELSASEHRRITTKIAQLVKLPAFLHSTELRHELEPFKKVLSVKKDITEAERLDEWKRAYGYGWRKSSSARAWLIAAKEGVEGQVRVNGKNLSDYFVDMRCAESVVTPLVSTDTVGTYNAWCLVRGGGTTGQAEAVRLALSRALLRHEPHLRPILRTQGLISHDWRTVERKKTGQPKARKKYTWVKR
jgi:small subunit ribosomal protein S9